MDKPTAARALTGMTLPGGWVVEDLIQRAPNATGGYFSAGYTAKKGDLRVFVKALDFSRAFAETQDPARVLQAMTTAYNYERDLSFQCRDRRLSRVATAIGEGVVRLPGYVPDVVHYLVFELADGDIRSYLDDERFELAWRLRSLHHVAVGTQQLHGQLIAHQDLKPSNVFVFIEQGSRIGDLGRASQKGNASPFEQYLCPGDPNYAPPEILFGYQEPDWTKRRFGCDLYLLGSLMMFFMARVSMTHALLANLPPALRSTTWSGSYGEALVHVKAAFDKVLVDLEKDLSYLGEAYSTALLEMIKQLCEPDPALRGHPENRHSQHSLERFVSRLDLLARRAEIES